MLQATDLFEELSAQCQLGGLESGIDRALRAMLDAPANLLSLNDTLLPRYEVKEGVIELDINGKGFNLQKGGEWEPRTPEEMG